MLLSRARRHVAVVAADAAVDSADVGRAAGLLQGRVRAYRDRRLGRGVRRNHHHHQRRWADVDQGEYAILSTPTVTAY